MPFTPYHWGPSSWIGLLLDKWLDFATLLIAGVIIDLEPGLVLLLKLDYPLHGFFHSFLGATSAAIILSILLYQTRNGIAPIMARLKLGQVSSFRKILGTSLLGVYSHILLDAPLYTDIKPFYPIGTNPFYRLIPSSGIYLFCQISFMVALILYGYQLGLATLGNFLRTAPILRMGAGSYRIGENGLTESSTQPEGLSAVG